MKKLIDLDEKITEKVQAVADAHFNGNFTAAIRYLLLTHPTLELLGQR